MGFTGSAQEHTQKELLSLYLPSLFNQARQPYQRSETCEIRLSISSWCAAVGCLSLTFGVRCIEAHSRAVGVPFICIHM